MKNTFKLASLLFVGVLLFQISCEEDPVTPPPVIPDPAGNWAMSMATFISTTDAPADVLTITEFTTDGVNFSTLEFPSGESILSLAAAALATTTCVNPANFGTFYLELEESGKLYFNCPAEDLREEGGNWIVTQDADGEYTVITLSVVVGTATLPITFSNFAIAADGNSFTGQAQGYPMKKSFIGESVASNFQFLVTDMTFTKVP